MGSQPSTISGKVRISVDNVAHPPGLASKALRTNTPAIRATQSVDPNTGQTCSFHRDITAPPASLRMAGQGFVVQGVLGGAVEIHNFPLVGVLGQQRQMGGQFVDAMGRAADLDQVFGQGTVGREAVEH
jgi:hypothetical protein